VREKGSFTIEEGVAALSKRVADFLGLDDRGTLEVGKAADVTIFDPEHVQPKQLETLDDIPGGGTRMTKAAQAINWVIVNGEPVIEDGVSTQAVPGKVLV
jgi:N-acyl-D-aspartate/D-glutamate deacylase